jgi:hypothetical protein
MLTTFLLTALSFGPGDLVSGPQPGQKFGPYAFLIATGPKRGTSHCYVCETGANPAVIVLARQNTVTLGEFLRQLDLRVDQHQAAKLHAWATFVGMPQPEKEPLLLEWSKKLGLRHVPLGIFEDALGPPGYRLSTEAEVTILLVKQNKVIHNFAYRPAGFTAAESKKVLDAVPGLVK